MKIRLILACLFAAATVSTAAPITVWNFDSWVYPNGPSNFQSDYTFVNPVYDLLTDTWKFDGNPGGSFWPEGVYAVAANPHDGHPYWANMSDVSGAGNMLVYNGSPEREVVWSTDVTGIAGEYYIFDFWFANVHADSPAALALHLTSPDADLALPGLVTLPGSDVGTWHHYVWEFHTPAANFSLVFRNENVERVGNDFAMDNLRLSAAPEPATFAVTGIALILIGAAFRCRWSRKVRLMETDFRR